MKKRTLTSIICALAILCFGFGLVGCQHQHSFSEDWTFDSEYHWHAATCEHTNEVSDKAKHTFRANGICMWCDYEQTQGGGEGGGNGGSEQEEIVFSTEPSQTVALPNNVDVIYENMMLSKIAGGTYELVALENPAVTEFTVPEQAMGVDITSIGFKAFSGNATLEKITLSDKITNIGEQALYNCANLKEVVLGSGVKKIDKYAFNTCPNLTTINLPEGLTSISDSAFAACFALDGVVLPSTLEEIGTSAFLQCEGLTAINFPESLKTIGYYAFYGCVKLTEIVIPSNIEEIGMAVFAECTSVQSLTVPYIGFDQYEGYFLGFLFDFNIQANASSPETSNAAVPASLKSVTLTNSYKLVDYAFAGCGSIQSIQLPDSLVYVGENAFKNCTSLAFTENNNGKYIGSEANPYLVLVDVIDKTATTFTVNTATKCIAGGSMAGCTTLTAVYISDNITSVGTGAFTDVSTSIFTRNGNSFYLSTPSNDYHALIRVQGNPSTYTFRDGVRVIAGGAFKGSGALATITIPEGVITIGDDAFSGCMGLTSVTIPDSVKAIGDGAFAGCQTVNSITAPAFAMLSINETYSALKTVKLTSGTCVPAYSFYGASSLTSVTLPDTLTRIEEYAFYQCYALATLNIPASVTKIDIFAFYQCSSLTKINLTNVEYIGDQAFYSCIGIAGQLILPESLEYIGYCAFDSLRSITDLYIGKNVSYMGLRAFGYCNNLKNVMVSSENSNYYSVGNCVMEIGTGVLLFGTITSEVPSGGYVTQFGDWAFYGRNELSSIFIGKEVVYLGESVFTGCTHIADIYYEGTLAEWRALEKGTNWNYVMATAVEGTKFTVHCSDGDSVEEGTL